MSTVCGASPEGSFIAGCCCSVHLLSHTRPQVTICAHLQVKVEDEEVLAKFMAPAGAAAQQRTLSDIIMERIRAKQAGGDASANAQ